MTVTYVNPGELVLLSNSLKRGTPINFSLLFVSCFFGVETCVVDSRKTEEKGYSNSVHYLFIDFKQAHDFLKRKK